MLRHLELEAIGSLVTTKSNYISSSTRTKFSTMPTTVTTTPFDEQSLFLNVFLASSSSWISKSLVIFFVMTSIDLNNKLGPPVQVPVYQEAEISHFNSTKNPSALLLQLSEVAQSPTQIPKIFPTFRHQPNGLGRYQPIPFQEEWLNDFNTPPHDALHALGTNHTIVSSPKSLPVPDFVEVFELKATTIKNTSLEELGKQARQIIDETLPSSGAILFRNLHQQIQNASDFATFWNHVVGSSDWNPMKDHLSCYNRKRQSSAAGVDRVDTDVPSYTIGPHNEHSCNPRPSDKIFFYALHPAVKGGESLLRRNKDIVVPELARKILEQAGGFHFTRRYPTQQQLDSLKHGNRHPTEMSWQERTNTHQHSQAKDYFATHHGITNVTFDPQDDTLTAHTILPGFLFEGEEEDQLLWFNRIDYGFPIQLADGAEFPLDLQSQLKRQKWHETSAFKLQQGDWLVLDNLRVQHGRLPYQDVKGHRARQLLVTYTSPSSS